MFRGPQAPPGIAPLFQKDCFHVRATWWCSGWKFTLFWCVFPKNIFFSAIKRCFSSGTHLLLLLLPPYLLHLLLLLHLQLHQLFLHLLVFNLSRETFRQDVGVPDLIQGAEQAGGGGTSSSSLCEAHAGFLAPFQHPSWSLLRSLGSSCHYSPLVLTVLLYLTAAAAFGSFLLFCPLFLFCFFLSFGLFPAVARPSPHHLCLHTVEEC